MSKAAFPEFADRGFKRALPILLAILASALLVGSLKLPLWQMRLEAPQYRDQEALRVAVHPGSLRGDIGELSVLDRYIGVHIPPTLPQFAWMPALLMAGGMLGFAASLLPLSARRRALVFVSCVLAAGLALSAAQAMFQIHDIGHKRDQKTVLAGVKDFTPPFLGTSKIAQFTVSSRFGLGAWLIGGALALQLGAAWSSRRPVERHEIGLAAKAREIPPHPGPVASQARHPFDAPQELNASRSVVPRGVGELSPDHGEPASLAFHRLRKPAPAVPGDGRAPALKL